jgi:hypothetical protein
MFVELLGKAALGGAMILGMVAAEKLVAMTQGRWRYSLRGLMIFTLLVSIVLTLALRLMGK